MVQQIDFETLLSLLASRPVGQRTIVAIAGAPGSGKSTLAKALLQKLNQPSPDRAALLPMDGFHYDDTVLADLGRLSRKGAVDTFDVGGLLHMLSRLRVNSADTVAVPVFDRDLEIARAGGRLIRPQSDIILFEGNYLLLRQKPWSELADFFDLTVMIKTDTKTLHGRLSRRWKEHSLSAGEIRRKVEENDLPNGRFVAENSRAADYCINT